MKQLVKNAICLSAFVCAILMLISCEQDAILKKYVYPVPEVSEVYPARGYVTQPFTIIGNNFGDRTEPIIITFGGIPAKKVISCKNNCIVVEVPEDAISGDVTLQIWTNPAISVGSLEVHPLPTITSVLSQNAEYGSSVAAAGDQVVITGTNFGTDTEKVSVSFNGTAAAIESLEDDRIVAITPDDYDSGVVTVTINQYTEYTLTGSKLVNPAKPGDVTALYLKNFTRPFIQIPYLDGQLGDGTMAIPTDWTVNDAAQRYVNKNATETASKVGGMFYRDDAVGMQTGWGHASSATSISNGKMYQTATVAPGKYKLLISCIASNVAAKDVYIVVNEGIGLPDVAPVKEETATTVLTKSKFTDGGNTTTPAIMSLEFECTIATQISIGFIGSFANDTYFKVSDIQLNLVTVIN